MVGETGRPLATFARYDTGRDRWEVLSPLPEPTRAAAAAALDGHGLRRRRDDRGREHDRDLGVRPVGAAVACAGSAACGALQPRRGRRSARSSTCSEASRTAGSIATSSCYEPAADEWKRVARLPRPNHAFGVVAYEGELWVIGGRRGEEILREVWILDPAASRWREGPGLPKPMELLGATVAGDDIHAVWESTYQVYDGASGRWRDGPHPVVTRHALEAFAVDGVLYAVGGCTTALRDSPVVERLEIGSR